MRGIGSSKVISTSKIKKITAIRKNCREKGVRDVFFGSNPHSKGERFSRSGWGVIDVIKGKSISKTEIVKTHTARKGIITTFSRTNLTNWKLVVLKYSCSLSSSSINWDV